MIFATDEELDRQIWVNKLYTATGQSHKPVAPKLSVATVHGQPNSLTRLQGGKFAREVFGNNSKLWNEKNHK